MPLFTIFWRVIFDQEVVIKSIYFVVKENNNDTENFHVSKLYFGRYVANQISVKIGNIKEHGHSRLTRR